MLANDKTFYRILNALFNDFFLSKEVPNINKVLSCNPFIFDDSLCPLLIFAA